MPPIAIIHLIIILESALRPSEIIVYLGNAGLKACVLDDFTAMPQSIVKSIFPLIVRAPSSLSFSAMMQASPEDWSVATAWAFAVMVLASVIQPTKYSVTDFVRITLAYPVITHTHYM